MSFGVTVHYEILGRRSTSWTILDVIKDRKSATAKAEQLWDGKQYKGLRVLKESYNKHTHEFSSLEIFSRGSTSKTSKYDETGTISPCLSPDDLYSPDGIRSIWQLLGNTLKKWQLTPTELLHNLDHYHKLYNFETKLQNAIQRTAISFEGSEGSIQERMRKIEKIIDASVDILKNNANAIPSLEMGRLKPIIQRLEKKPNKRFLLMAALADYVRPASTVGDKFGRVAIFLSTNRADWVTECLDQLLSDFLHHTSVLDALLAQTPDRGLFMTQLAHLQAGSLNMCEPENDASNFNDEVTQLNKFMGKNMLPKSAHVLFLRLKHELLSSKPINEGGLIEQLNSLTDLQNTLTNLDQGVHSIEAANEDLVLRASRLINSQSISDLIYAVACPVAQIHALLDLEIVTIGMTNKRTVANYILPILANSAHSGTFIGLDSQPLNRMTDLTALQQKVLSTGLTEMHKRQISEKLDDFCRTILNNTQVLKKIHQQSNSLQEKATQILSMMIDGYFTTGDCFDRAETQVRAYMKQPGFTEGLVRDIDLSMVEKTLLDFKELLDQSGLSTAEKQKDETLESLQEASVDAGGDNTEAQDTNLSLEDPN